MGSNIVKINGWNAESYLEKLSDGYIYHDIDTRYNTNFQNPARAALGVDTGGLTFQNYVCKYMHTGFT